MTGAAAADAAAAAGPPAVAAGDERCPLCGAGLQGAQQWCMRCGAAARTRLAATPRWWVPVLILATVSVVAIGVLIASLTKLA